ncbi:MAG: 50S ribosomal protein L18e [Candidatus Micrarchaeota archaeon]
MSVPAPAFIFEVLKMKHGTEIQSLRKLLVTLEKAGRKDDAAIWGRAAFYLRKPTRQRVEVNLNRLGRVLNDGETALVPGKVLGIGEMRKKAKIAAFRFSKSALVKLKKGGAETMSIEKLVQLNAKGSKVRLII